MSRKNFLLIRIIIWLAPISLLLAFAYNYFSFGGHFHYQYDFEKKSGFVSRFYSPANYEIIDDEKIYIKIFKTPTAFNLLTPTKFEQAKVKLTFQSDDLDEFQFGIIKDRGKTQFELQKVKNENKSEWNMKEIEIDLRNAFYDPKDKYGFVFMFENGELKVKNIEFNLTR